MDDALRALERQVATTGEPAARLALAKQLERLGRRDEAQQVLWHGRESAEVRRALAEFPIATAIGFPGGTSTDTLPLRARPRVRWRHEQARAVRFGRIFFAPSPLGVACCVDGRRLLVLDPDDGRVRWQRPLALVSPADRPRIEGEALIVPDGHAETILDLWTGTPRSRRQLVRATTLVEANEPEKTREPSVAKDA